MLPYLHSFQHSPSPIPRFLDQHTGFIPVHSVLLFPCMDRNVSSLHCCLVLHQSLLQIPPCRSNVCELLQSKHGTLYTTPFFNSGGLGSFTFIRDPRRVPLDLNTALIPICLQIHCNPNPNPNPTLCVPMRTDNTNLDCGLSLNSIWTPYLSL